MKYFKVKIKTEEQFKAEGLWQFGLNKPECKKRWGAENGLSGGHYRRPSEV